MSARDAARLRYTTLAHGALEVLDPLPPEAIGEALDALALPAAPRILDLGCGKGALLIAAVERLGGEGRGIDLNPAFVAAGRALVAAHGLADRVALELGEVRADALEAGAWDLVLCVGARPLGRTLEENLTALARLLRPGGAVLLGEGYWRRAPDPDYLALLGAGPEEMPSRAELDTLAVPGRLRVRRVIEASTASWDAYEGAYLANMLAFCAAHPEDPDAAAFEARARGWYAAYERWGRDTLGFALVALS
ncbi:MAG: class I SAM-dependent methyltransferase [Deltaproteobacteria bacterium]|nr:MAG: class I SAM-dependent methyltransferase [Deltaproteobacteria bacterium]